MCEDTKSLALHTATCPTHAMGVFGSWVGRGVMSCEPRLSWRPGTSVGRVKVIENQCLRAAGEGRVNVQIHKADPEVAHLGDHLPAGQQLPIPGRPCLLPGPSQPTQLRGAQMPLPWPWSPARGSGLAELSHLPPLNWHRGNRGYKLSHLWSHLTTG